MAGRPAADDGLFPLRVLDVMIGAGLLTDPGMTGQRRGDLGVGQ